jgi:ABC-type Na+ efflux pump permease subunit
MRKIWTIAVREYRAMVATKAFVITVTLMPVLMFGGIFVANRLEKIESPRAKTIVLADGTGGELFADLERHVETFNAASQGAGEAPGPTYKLLKHPTPVLSDDDRLKLSDQVRNDQIEAFAEIPAALLTVDGTTPATVKYYANNAILSQARAWLERAVNEAVTARRLAQLQLDADAVRRATAPVSVEPTGLFKKSADGRAQGADSSRKLAGLFVPMGFMMLMFLVIMMSAQPLLESVMEEKSGRIAEVLLGSVNTFQLMAGKLLGNVAGSISVVGIYGVGAYVAAAYNGWTDLIPLDAAPWFIAYQVLAVLLFSSIFMAVGAAVTQLKEAQSALLPVWLLMALPMFAWLQIVREPNGPVAVWMSFFPPAAPMTMVLRLASEAVIPMSHVAGSLAILVATTVVGVFLAARIFRVGILWQGKAPKLRELAAWALRG